MSTALFLFDQEHTFKSEPPYHTHTPWLLCTTQDSHKKQTGYSLGILQKTGWDWSGNWPCNPSWDQPPTSPSSPSNPRHGNIRSPAKCFTLQIYPYRVSPRGSAGTATFTAISTSLWGTLFWLQPFPCSSVCLIPETGHQCQTGHLALRNAKWRGRVSTPPSLAKLPTFCILEEQCLQCFFILQLEKLHVSYSLPPHQWQWKVCRQISTGFFLKQQMWVGWIGYTLHLENPVQVEMHK